MVIDPAVPVINRIQRTLASGGAPGTFGTRYTAGINDVYFDVVGVGAVLHGADVLGLGLLHDGCTRMLTKFAATPPPRTGNWSIATQLGCKCELWSLDARSRVAAREREDAAEDACPTQMTSRN